jgi:DNA invertase Pin-like site-specific DNA recombinase
MTGDAPASQLSRTLGMLALMQVHVPWEGVFFDQWTGTEFATRGEFQRLLEHCWLGHFAVVGALISERLFRNANDAEQTRAEFRRHGIRLEYGNKPHGDERDPSTWKALKDQDTQDEYYARRTSWHIGTTKEYLSRQGRPQGRLPEGYKVKDRGPSFMGPGRPDREL